MTQPKLSIPFLLAMGEIVDKNRHNDFDELDSDIDAFISGQFSLSRTYTCRIHLGKNLTYHSKETAATGTTTMVLGDKQHSYVTILDHGTNLEGIVSVLVSIQVDLSGGGFHRSVILEVLPVVEHSNPFLGTIWMDDLQNMGECPTWGYSKVFSAGRVSLPMPGHPDMFNHLIKDFCLGLVRTYENDPTQTSLQLILNPFGFGERIFISPAGQSVNGLPEEYVLKATNYLRKPKEMSDTQFMIIKMAFHSGISIFTEASFRESAKTTNADFTMEDVDKILIVLHRMVKAGWFTLLFVRDRNYFVPTPKLYANL